MRERQRRWHLNRFEWTAVIVAAWMVLVFTSS